MADISAFKFRKGGGHLRIHPPEGASLFINSVDDPAVVAQLFTRIGDALGYDVGAVRSGVLEFRLWSSWRPATGDAFGRHGYEYRVPAGWSA